MLCKKYFCLLLIIVVSQVNPQTKPAVTGIITDVNETPIENANIKIQNSFAGTISDKEGKYVIKNLPVGDYTLIVSSVGYKTQSKFVPVSGDKTVQINFILLKENIEIEDVVVTGTRTEKNRNNSPIKTNVISAVQIQRSAFTRLDEILLEQPGLVIVDDHGKGIQMQGLDPAYTLILVDGEPIIGRTAGTMELSRFSVSNLKQVEIVKGASSSLYGSEALAGVINLITEIPDEPYNLRFQSYYKTNNTIDFIGNAIINQNNIGASIFLDRLSSDGYDLFPNSLSLTAPKFSSYTINPKVNYKLGDNSSIKYSGRILFEEQKNDLQLIIDENEFLINGKDKLTDWNNSFSFEHKFDSIFKSEVKFYVSRFFTDSKLTYDENGNIYDQSMFDQYLYKGELKNDILINDENYVVAGAGYFSESVEADRIYSGKKIASSYYLFAQEEWIPNDVFDLVSGVRFDWHSEYASRLSPKFSALVKPFGFLKIRASFGGGFKAPTLQLLYLDFSNPQVGYGVFGSSNIEESFRQLEQEGQIQRILIDPYSLEKIKAESSIAFNLGFDISPWNFINASINFFRNNVKDLIEATPVAVKTNGQNVFTYFNLNKIYTQGFESELTFEPFYELSFSISYQYMEAIDEEVLEQVRNGEISKAGSNGRVRAVQESEYGGLYNRSKHSGTIKINYENAGLGISAGLRGIIRGKYGFGDTNGNGILDDKSEYVPGYAIWNFTISKEIGNYFTLLFGMENFLDKTNPEFIPSLPGRIIYGGIQFSLF